MMCLCYLHCTMCTSPCTLQTTVPEHYFGTRTLELAPNGTGTFKSFCEPEGVSSHSYTDIYTGTWSNTSDGNGAFHATRLDKLCNGLAIITTDVNNVFHFAAVAQNENTPAGVELKDFPTEPLNGTPAVFDQMNILPLVQVRI